MNRKNFISILGAAPFVAGIAALCAAATNKPELFYFKDDGKIPNSKLPLLLYRDIFSVVERKAADFIDGKFAENNWTNSWHNGIYPFHHYHSTSHEVLGIYSGKALLHLGGENGKKLEVTAGDIIVIPAGVGHKKLESENLGVVGAYPDGRSWDLKRGEAGERPGADNNIRKLPIPVNDPFLGKKDGLTKIWM